MSDHYLGGHYQAMVDLHRRADNAPRDRLVALAHALLDEPDINTSPHLLALVMRHIEPPASELPYAELATRLDELRSLSAELRGGESR